jgi:hypothetical protein
MTDVTDPLSIATDQADYQPGTTATITATNVEANADGSAGSVTFEVQHITDVGPDGIAGTADDTLAGDLSGTGTTWTVVDGGAGDLDGIVNGIIVTNWSVNPDAAGQLFLASAISGASTATTTFTDATPIVAVVTGTTDAMFNAETINLKPFVSIQNPGNDPGDEAGFNTDGLLQLDTKAGHSITVGDIPTVTIDSVVYREFWLDLTEGQAGGDPTITLTDLRLYSASTGDAIDLTGLNKIYDIDSPDNDVSILLNGWKPGTGFSDYQVLIPDSYFASLASGDNIYLYSKFSGADSGAEDWSVAGSGDLGGGGGNPEALLSLDKTTQDMGTPNGTPNDGDTILAGESIQWIYTLTNTGDIGSSISNVTLTDDQLGVIYSAGALADLSGLGLTAHLSGDTNNDGILQDTETWTFTVTGATAQSGSYANVGTAGGTSVETGSPVTIDDASSYFGAAPGITIVKEVSVDGGANWFEANSAATAPTLLSSNGNPMFEYLVQNTGNVDLSAPTVTDDKLGAISSYSGDTNSDGKLSVGETWTYTATGTWASGLNTNIGDAKDSFKDMAGHTADLHDTDAANYFGATAAISIDKKTQDIHSPAGSAADGNIILAGEAIQWIYTVTNGGNVALSGIAVTDDHSGVTPLYQSGDTDSDGQLDTTETWIYTANGVATTGTYSNTGTASGSFTDSAGHTANPSDSNGSSYFGADPEIAINKVTISGIQSGDGINVLAGAGLHWQYTVSNIGNEPLSNVILTDDKLGTLYNGTLANTAGYDSQGLKVGVTLVGDTNSDHILQQSETWIFTASGTATTGIYTNTGTASGSFTDTAVHAGTDTEHDSSGYNAFSGSALTQGYWGSHTWTYSTDKTGYLLLGDSNGNGKVDDAHDLWISVPLGKKLESLSTTGDARVIMLQQTIAAQLNIDNHTPQPFNVIDESVMWLTGKGAWTGNGVNVDPNNDGIVDGTNIALSGTAIKTSSAAWQAPHDVVDTVANTNAFDFNSTTSGYHEADGEGLKNALMWFNQDQLVASGNGPSDLVAWNNGGTIVSNTVHANGQDQFWDTLHQAGLDGYLGGTTHTTLWTDVHYVTGIG